MAHQSGLPVKHFIAACNANDVVPKYFNTGKYEPQKAIATISNAMDVGDPSNFVRIREMYKNDEEGLGKIMSSVSISDDITKSTLKEVFEKENYLLDPHGAVAYHALKNYLEQNKNSKGIFLETAHPVKFFDVVEPIIQQQVPIPGSVQQQLKKEKKSIKMAADARLLKEFLLNI